MSESSPTRQWLLVCLAAVLFALPLKLHNPDFVRTPFEVLEIICAIFFVAAAIGGAFALVGRLLRGDVETAGSVGAALALIGAAAFTGFVVSGGPWLALLAAALAVPGALAVILASREGRALGRGGYAGLLLAPLFLIGLLALRSDAEDPRRQVILVGLDGAGWNIIDPLIERGEMPTFASLLERGARTDLDVIEPVISPPIWTSIASGRSPQHHGVLDFWSTSLDVKTKRIWEMVDDRDYRSGVLGYLVTWPPNKSGGFLVPGWMAQGTETVPEDLEFLKRIELQGKETGVGALLPLAGLALQSLHHGTTLGTLNRAAIGLGRRVLGLDSELERILFNPRIRLHLSLDVFCQLLRRQRPHLGVFYYSSLDEVEHRFFKYFTPENFPGLDPEQVEELGAAIPEMHREVDRGLKRLTASIEPEADLIIVSDHGQVPGRPEGGGSYVTVLGSQLVERLGIGESVRATNTGVSIYVRSVGEEAAYVEALDKISRVTTADGEPFFELEKTSPTESYVNVRFPDIDPETAVLLSDGEEFPASTLVSDQFVISGVHTRDALFYMSGEGVHEGQRIERGSVLDIVPTILARLGLPLGRDLEGEVMNQAFDPSSIDEIRYIDTYGPPEGLDGDLGRDIDDELRERLKTLGYIQ